jgi:hypothetical protein
MSGYWRGVVADECAFGLRVRETGMMLFDLRL